MKKEEIKKQINEIIWKCVNDMEATNRLANLFIELSNERCKEQKQICANKFLGCYSDSMADEHLAIFNAPLPEII